MPLFDLTLGLTPEDRDYIAENALGRPELFVDIASLMSAKGPWVDLTHWLQLAFEDALHPDVLALRLRWHNGDGAGESDWQLGLLTRAHPRLMVRALRDWAGDEALPDSPEDLLAHIAQRLLRHSHAQALGLFKPGYLRLLQRLDRQTELEQAEVELQHTRAIAQEAVALVAAQHRRDRPDLQALVHERAARMLRAQPSPDDLEGLDNAWQFMGALRHHGADHGLHELGMGILDDALTRVYQALPAHERLALASEYGAPHGHWAAFAEACADNQGFAEWLSHADIEAAWRTRMRKELLSQAPDWPPAAG